MKRLFNFIRGIVVLQVTIPFPERFVNLCAQENLEFWAMDWLDGNTVRLTARRRDRKRILEIAQTLGGEAQVESSRGLPEFLPKATMGLALVLRLYFTNCSRIYVTTAISVRGFFVL